MKIQYVIGDATEPQLDENNFVMQVVNNVGKYGAGFSGAVAKKWPTVREIYLDRWRNYDLGQNLNVIVGKNISVVNLFAQAGVRSATNPKPIRYVALVECLSGIYPSDGTWTCHMPKIGCGLAGASWPLVSEIIEETLCAKGYRVLVYDLPK